MPQTEQSEWIIEALREIETAEAVLKEPHWLNGDLPMWVQNLSHALFKSLIPDVKLKPISEWTAGEVGALYGHKVANIRFLFEGEEYSAKEFRKAFSFRNEGLPEEMIELRGMCAVAIRFIKRIWQTGCPRFELALSRTLSMAARAPHHESVRFFKAFSKAMQKVPSPTGEQARSTTATNVYFVMLISWRWVQSMPSAAALHKFLTNLLGPSVAGDPKRVEKICERLGLKFGQPFQAFVMPEDTDKPA